MSMTVWSGFSQARSRLREGNLQGSTASGAVIDLRFVHYNHAVELRMSLNRYVTALAGKAQPVEYPLTDGYLSHSWFASAKPRGEEHAMT
ncbi:MAG: hypothetical protein ACRDKI_08450, partial [Solirubrobacterales bacterium]